MPDNGDSMIDKLKANPVMVVAIVVAIIGTCIAVYGHFKTKGKYVTYGGGALAVGALITAIGAWAYEKYKTPDEEATAYRQPQPGTVGNGVISTPN